MILQFRKFYKQFLISTLLSKGLFFLSLQICLVLAVTLFALLVSGENIRILLQILFWASSLFLILIFVFKLKRELHWKNLCLLLEKKSALFHNLLNALELSRAPLREGVSEDLKNALIQEVSACLQEANPKDWIQPLKLKLYSLSLLAALSSFLILFLVPPRPLLTGWNKLFFGDEKELARVLRITPAGGKVLAGESVTVTCELISLSHPAPKLFVHTSLGWKEVEGESEGRKTSFLLKSLTEPTRYKVRWKTMESAVYAFLPVHPPRLANFTIQLTYPSYTGLAKETLQQEPQLQVWRGTKIEIEAQATKNLKEIQMITSEGVRLPVQLSKGKKIKVDFFAQNPTVFHFEMEDTEGIQPREPAQYHIRIQEDRAPSVRLLAPVTDLIVGKEARIPFTFEIKDELGIPVLFLKVTRGDETSQRILLKRYQPPVVEKIDDAEFAMSSIRPVAGELLKLQLEAQDNDLVTGPKSGFSEIILVEIRSYEKEHQDLQKELKEFRKDLLELLAEQILARLPDEKASWNEKAQESLKKQSQPNLSAEQIEKQLDKILERMERDPLTDFAVWNEHRAIQSSLGYLRSQIMQQAERNLKEQKFEEALKEQDFAIAELERLSTLSEELQKYAKMRDLMHQADRLAEKGGELSKKLSGSDSLNDELYKLLSETLRETMEILKEIQKQMQELPQELPEDFVNQPAVKELNLDEISRSAEQLMEALQRRDMKAALEAAQELLRQAKAAREMIAKAAQEFSLASADAMEKRNQELFRDLSKIVDQQEKMLEKTSLLESKRKQAYLERQKALLLELAARQKKVVTDSQATVAQLRQIPAPNAHELKALLEAALPTMKSVLGELEKQNVIFSQKWLSDILQMLAPSLQIHAKLEELKVSTPLAAHSPTKEVLRLFSLSQKVVEIRNEEEQILEQLKNPPALQEHSFSQQDQKELENLSAEQKELAEQTRKLREQISRAAQETASIDLPVLDSLRSAQGEMNKASKSLKESRAETAQGQQQRALSHLRRGQEGMQQAMSQPQARARGGGAGERQSMIQPRNLPGGYTGFRTGMVDIPGAEEYLPPREFREELLESLKERYPKKEESVIKDYYKKLTQ